MPLTHAESRVEVHAELLQSVGLRPGEWLHLASSVWERAESGGSRTYTALHVQVTRDELDLASEGTDQEISAIRVLSWGIECYSPQHAFPTATNVDDVIIAIGLCSRTLYADSPQAAREERVGLSLHDVALPPNTNVTVVSFDTEVALLKALAAYIQHSDADVLVGYNTCGSE